MKTFTFVLFVVLLTLISFFSTHQEVEIYRAGYRLGRLTHEKLQLQNEIMLQKNELAYLKNPAKLVELNEKLNLGLKPLPALCTGSSAVNAVMEKGS
ncbi:MAG: hypothetical protein ACYTFY_00845 [Planctomycetota bacterium]|jgi:hypothetical protein